MSIPNLLKTLKTVKGNCQSNPSSKPLAEIISTILAPAPFDSTESCFISQLNPHVFTSILSNPNLRSSECFHFFDFCLKNQPLMSFTPDLQAHLTVICRLLKARMFSDAASLLKTVSIDGNLRYSFAIIASTVESCCQERKVKVKFFNFMLALYSESGFFDSVSETFSYMKNNGIMIDEQSCTVHLLSLKGSNQMHLALDFFYRMLKSRLAVSVYSLTVVVDILCWNGEIKRGRELVEETLGKGIKPNIVTFNVMVSACAKRWNFEELDLILILMEKEEVRFDANTYKLLIDGFTSSGRTEAAKNLVMKMHDEGLKADSHLYNLIIRSYCKAGAIQSACLVFDEMSERNIATNSDTYWALIDGLCKVGDMGLAVEYVNGMQSKGIKMDEAIFDALVDGFCVKGMVDEAIELQIMMEKDGYQLNPSVCEKIVLELWKLNRTKEATMVLSILAKRGADLRRLIPTTLELI
ncbi:pentatricopeptide repeat-containing protein At2g28050 [Cucurbita moschata]|uniref:Pentatricopeptide repeat-containing protein At2g28050 n=1 Tax=Cucurbita moschata TaxID=3662 RepID=A0A6J1FRJ8_CUCMO|nr:pentatricopeptide repeat-containing protein At2g28050 [Cucurbita moschata]